MLNCCHDEGYALSREALARFIEDALPDAQKCNQSHTGDEDTQLGSFS